MRFPAPDRLKFQHVAIFAFVVFVGQELEGTDFLFAVLTAAYTLIWAAAFNIAGGIRYPSGAFIFFNGFLNGVVGLTFKVLLFEPGDRNLQSPNATMFVYCVGMASMLCVAFFCRGLRLQRGLLTGLESVAAYKRAAVVCLVSGYLITLIVLAGSSNAFVSILRQANKMPEMSIMLATTYEIRHSKGKRSFNWIVAIGIGSGFAMGLIGFSKEGMLLGFAAYFLAAVIEGYNFPRIQIVAGILGFAFFTYYLAPYSQYVRGFRATTAAGNAAVALHYLGDLNETRRLYEDTLEGYLLADEPHLYDQREGFLDRLIVIPADDNLISYTNKGNVFGLTPTFAAYGNLVPHFIWHNKPVFNTGNIYAHELGELGEEDETTGIAFSAAADAYHQAKWLGLLLLLPIDLFLYFIITDSIVGSARWAPWALIPILDLSEIGPEGGLDGPIYSASYGIFAILFLVFVVKFVAPFVLRVMRQPQLGPLAANQTRLTSSGSISGTVPNGFNR
jgi:hypothetical protein